MVGIIEVLLISDALEWRHDMHVMVVLKCDMHVMVANVSEWRGFFVKNPGEAGIVASLKSRELLELCQVFFGTILANAFVELCQVFLSLNAKELCQVFWSYVKFFRSSLISDVLEPSELCQVIL